MDISLLRNSLYLYGMFLGRFLRRKHKLDIVGYFIAEEIPIQVWDVSQKFSEKKTYLDIVSQKQISCDFEYFLCCCKMKKTFLKFQL